MADLDDFFAKKDRKKGKGKKFTTADEIAKKLEETGKRVDKQKFKEKVSDEEQPTPQPEEDDEWKEFTEEKKDYTGLKLGNLTVTDAADDSEDERGSGENSSDGETGESGSKHSGPWKKPEGSKTDGSTESSDQQQKPLQNPQLQQTQQSNPSTGVYKSPHLRNQSINVPKSRLKNVAPDLKSEEYFPTLNSKQPQTETYQWGKKKREEGNFEEVRNRGGSKTYGQDSQTQALSLDNKYGALSQDQS